MSWQHELGDQIRKARERIGMSQKELANGLSVTREQVSNYENGRCAPPVNVVAEIAKALNVEFVVGGCKIGCNDANATPLQKPAQQLCFAYDTEHRFAATTLTIKPRAGSILISAVVRRLRRRAS
jgi:transcriptional regulator with XRE-family HTH domain